ncbi:GmrSD restriction endonuclease domain-containing protein [Desulfolutivibrio sulfoxidireducens]|uniref:GmrSD restriction endonuclease domain-containing protein n=1 Tax=Desulfolutivibrio sulfoxidireducens TaxID=2773299 RepID=UPI00159DFB25|nr:DUF262 domain-containing protein [Desulfolutivibrio sulfoxidireducens]QLA20146.1 DUF262 domain-containing protein [Desulfolutivibrio sulfoxidireducens]
MNQVNSTEWFEDYAEGTDDIQIDEYDITSTPNDFNVITINSFIESGAVKIPGFQRNFVWDIGRSSKLIESLILGLPVPQLFLYEKSRNSFLVIDGQQRLMSIYYFIKKKFPKKEKRVELRGIFDKEGKIPDEILHDEDYFEPFNLRLPERLPNHPNKFKGLNYATLKDYKSQFDLRPIRNIIIKQTKPKEDDGDDSSMYEVFNRLNTGGINLRPQEIRTSMYHSEFYTMLYRINGLQDFRRFLPSPEPDLHMKDIEILLRGYAMLIDSNNYAPSMVKFLNKFSNKCTKNTAEQNQYLEHLFNSFLLACSKLETDAFQNKKNKRFNIALYEAIFTAICAPFFENRKEVDTIIQADRIRSLESDQQFIEASLEGTTRTSNVTTRISRAKQIIWNA